MSLCQEPVAALAGKPPAHQSRCGVLTSTMCVEGHLGRAPAAGVFTVRVFFFFLISKHYPGHRIDGKHTQSSSKADQRVSSPRLLVSHGSFLSLPDLEGTIPEEGQESGQD